MWEDYMIRIMDSNWCFLFCWGFLRSYRAYNMFRPGLPGPCVHSYSTSVHYEFQYGLMRLNGDSVRWV